MQKIPIDLAREGMVLASDVFHPGGGGNLPVCGKGIILTGPLIERMTRMEVRTISIEGHPVEVPGELSLEEQLAGLDRRFRKVMAEPRMARLYQTFKDLLTASRNGLS
jgi:hypothetical protein